MSIFRQFLSIDPIREFEYRGHQCFIAPSPFAGPNGYVIGEIAKHVQGYDDVNEVFWSRGMAGSNGEWTFFHRIGDVACVGFDTGHAHDLDNPKDADWVEVELRRGVDNLIATHILPLLDDKGLITHIGAPPLTLGAIIRGMFGGEQ